MGKLTINGHFQSLFVCLPERKSTNQNSILAISGPMTVMTCLGITLCPSPAGLSRNVWMQIKAHRRGTGYPAW